MLLCPLIAVVNLHQLCSANRFVAITPSKPLMSAASSFISSIWGHFSWICSHLASNTARISDTYSRMFQENVNQLPERLIEIHETSYSFFANALSHIFPFSPRWSFPRSLSPILEQAIPKSQTHYLVPIPIASLTKSMKICEAARNPCQQLLSELKVVQRPLEDCPQNHCHFQHWIWFPECWWDNHWLPWSPAISHHIFSFLLTKPENSGLKSSVVGSHSTNMSKFFFVLHYFLNLSSKMWWNLIELQLNENLVI